MKLNRTTKFDSLPANVKGPAKAAGATATKASGPAAGAAAGGASGASKVDADSLQLSAVAGQVSTNDAPQVSLGADLPLPKTQHLDALRAAAAVPAVLPVVRAATAIAILATEIANRMFDTAQ